jgi:hypothetical protein
MPWANGRYLLCDFTRPDTLAASHLDCAVMLAPGAVAKGAQQRKRTKYLTLAAHCHFVSVARETLGSLGDEVIQFLRIFGC